MKGLNRRGFAAALAASGAAAPALLAQQPPPRRSGPPPEVPPFQAPIEFTRKDVPVRLWLSLIAYNPGNFWRRPALPRKIGNWSLTSLQQRLVQTSGRLIKHPRYYWLLLAESHLTWRMFAAMARRIAALPAATGWTETVGAAKIRRPGREGRRDVHGMPWKGRVCNFGFLAAKVALGGAENGSRIENCNSENRGWRLGIY